MSSMDGALYASMESEWIDEWSEGPSVPPGIGGNVGLFSVAEQSKPKTAPLNPNPKQVRAMPASPQARLFNRFDCMTKTEEEAEENEKMLNHGVQEARETGIRVNRWPMHSTNVRSTDMLSSLVNFPSLINHHLFDCPQKLHKMFGEWLLHAETGAKNKEHDIIYEDLRPTEVEGRVRQSDSLKKLRPTEPHENSSGGESRKDLLPAEVHEQLWGGDTLEELRPAEPHDNILGGDSRKKLLPAEVQEKMQCDRPSKRAHFTDDEQSEGTTQKRRDMIAHMQDLVNHVKEKIDLKIQKNKNGDKTGHLSLFETKTAKEDSITSIVNFKGWREGADDRLRGMRHSHALGHVSGHQSPRVRQPKERLRVRGREYRDVWK